MKYPKVFNSMFKLKSKGEQDLKNSISTVKHIRESKQKEEEKNRHFSNKTLLNILFEQKTQMEKQIDILLENIYQGAKEEECLLLFTTQFLILFIKVFVKLLILMNRLILV